MKCPKCSYLGFETGDRCKNCGYDFSLLAAAPPPDADLPLREPHPFAGTSNQWLDDLDRGLGALAAPVIPPAQRDPLAPLPLDTVTLDAVTIAVPAATPPVAAEPVTSARAAARVLMPPLPLFAPASGDDDQPLIKVPATPRPPLAVRRTPDRPRLRAAAKPVRGNSAEAASTEPVLQFPDERIDVAIRRGEPAPLRQRALPVIGEVSGAARRLAATLLDHAILTGIDAVVIYFTLKMAALAPGEWTQLPPIPLLAFLLMVKVAYFYAFTLVGGQTVGKMAARIRVVADDEPGIDPRRAMRRTLAGAVSLLTLGLGYLPVFFAADRRALHDRLARTRVLKS